MDDFDETVRKIIKKNNPKTTDAEIGAWSESTHYWEAENFRSAARWVLSAMAAVRTPASLSIDRTFVRLWGAIVEVHYLLRDKAEPHRNLLGVSEADMIAALQTNRDRETREFLINLWNAYIVSREIFNALSDDDRFLLGFLRHRVCHPVLSDYKAKLSGKVPQTKIKTEKWERLKKLGDRVKQDKFKAEMIEKLRPHLNHFAGLIMLLRQCAGEKIQQD